MNPRNRFSIYNVERVSDPHCLKGFWLRGRGSRRSMNAIRGCGWKRLRLPCWKGNARWVTPAGVCFPQSIVCDIAKAMPFQSNFIKCS